MNIVELEKLLHERHLAVGLRAHFGVEDEGNDYFVVVICLPKNSDWNMQSMSIEVMVNLRRELLFRTPPVLFDYSYAHDAS